jgi:hypothetical protein
MKRSPVLDAVLVGALMIGATAMTAFIKGMPEPCGQPTAASVESLFAPCLVAERQDRPTAADMAALYFPPPPLRPGDSAVAARPARDVDATGSVPQAKR